MPEFRAGFRIFRIFMAMTVLSLPAAEAAGLPMAPSPASPAFRADFERFFRAGEASRLRKLASGHQDQLRPFFDQLLAQFQSASLSHDAGKKKAVIALAFAVAEQMQRVCGERFARRRAALYSRWTPPEMESKSRADAFMRKAGAAFAEGRYGDVADPAGSALEIYEKLGDGAGEGDALHLLGRAERKLARYAKALASHERALALARRSGDSFREGRSLTDLADVYEREKDLRRAVALYRRALGAVKMPADWREASRALRQLGDVYTGAGDFVRAYKAYSQALSYAESARDARLTAEADDYLGYCHRRLGELERAMQYHRAALRISAGLTDPVEASKARARALNHLGLCSLEMAERAVSENNAARAGDLYRQAESQEKEALEFAQQSHDMWRQGYVLRALCRIHLQLGAIAGPAEAAAEYRKALGLAGQALALARSMKEREWEGLALHELGLAQLRLGRKAAGFATFERALGLWGRIGDLMSEGYAYRFMAREFFEPNRKFARAIASYERAREDFQKLGDSESEACVMTDLAHLYGEIGRKDDAVRLYDRAVAMLEKVRSKAGLPEFKEALMGKVYDRYEDAALFMLENGMNDRAFRLVESMKARLFLDQLAEAHVNIEKGIDPEMRRKRDRIENELSFTATGIIDALQRQPPDEAEVNRLRKRQEDLEAQLDTLRKQIRLKNPLYSSVQYPRPVTVSKLRTKVLEDNEALIEYFVSKKDVYCFVVTKENYRVAKLSVNAAALRSRVEALLDNLIMGPVRGEGFDRAAAAELYDILLRPFQPAIGKRTLFIVPDGILARLPFEALVVTEGDKWHYFVQSQTIKYLQSASVLAELRSFPKKSGASASFVGFGDPVFDYADFKAGKPERGELPKTGQEGRLAVARYGKDRGELGRLKASGDEVRAISRLFGENHLKHESLLRADATEDRAKSVAMEKFGYIHFSTHGLLAPDFQAIALSQIPGDKEDGFLTLGEIMNLKYRARLIVLSACDTGLGPAERGEGVTGLTRAVMYAGSPAAVVSLWGIDDKGTKELMVRFYDNMIRKGLAKAEALRCAKEEMLKTKYRHPFFWSAFVMYGE